MGILIAEPDGTEARQLAEGLAAEGLLCDLVADGPQALERAPHYEALVAEVALPGFSGLDLARRMRESGATTPLLLLSVLATPEHRVRGLEAGADDYLGKPYALAELAARLRALIRRSRMPARVRRVRVGDLTWEPDQRRISRSGSRLDLTPKEYALLALLLERPGEVVSREDIARTLWGAGKDHPELRSANALDAQVRRLRAKVDGAGRPALLHTLRGQGLRIEAP